MIKIDQQSFTASWNSNNGLLNPNHGSPLWVLAKKVAYLVFYIPHCAIAACVNPRPESTFSSYYSKKAGYQSFTKQIITPDRISLVSEINVIDGATSQTPTVILFNPLGAEYSINHGLRCRLISKGCNVVQFDYRGLGSTRRPEDLVLDGDSVYQYVTKELGTTAHKVHLYGYSLGGALAAQVKALHPESEGKYAGDRPFKSVFSLLTEICSTEKLGWLIKKISLITSAILIAIPVYLIGWEWSGDWALCRFSGEVLVIHHPNDILIPSPASFASLCRPDQVISLDPNEKGPSTHFAPIDSHMTSTGDCAADAVADFLAD